MTKKKIRHVCGISGGKDSAALAIYLKQQGRIPEMEYYFSDVLFDADWLDLYAGAGFGIFIIDEVNSSGNLVLGGTIWVTEKIGIRLQGVGKFAVNAKDRQFDNNHFQYMLQAVFKL